MTWTAKQILLSDSDFFQTLNGLWKGKKEPFVIAGVIRNTNFTPNGVIDYSRVAWLEVEEKKLEKRKLEPGDIIIERSGGGPKQPVGRVVFFEKETGSFSFSNFTSTIRVADKTSFYPKFVFYRLMELYQSGQTEDLQRRTTGIRNLDFTSYKDRASFPQVSIEEQKKIAHILSMVQRGIEQQQRLIQITTELKKTLMQKFFTEGLHNEPQKETEIGLVPESWDVVPLGELVTATQYGLSVKGNADGNYPILRMTNQINGRISSSNLQHVQIEQDIFKKFRVDKEDILFNRTNSFELVGRTSIFDLDDDFVFASYLIRVKTDKQKLNPFYLNDYFSTDETQLRLKSIATRAVSQSNISATRLKTFVIPLPGKDEQQEVVDKLEVFSQKIEIHSKKKKLLEDLFRTLLHKLMTAQIRVDEIEFDGLSLTNSP